MLTTIDLDDDLLAAARQLAQQRGVTVGQVISELSLESLTFQESRKVRNGVMIFALNTGGSRPDMQTVSALRDEA